MDARSIKIAGEVFALQSGRSQAAQLVISGGVYRLEINAVATEQRGPISDLRIEPALGSMPRKIYLADGALFTSADHDTIRQFEKGAFSKLSSKTLMKLRFWGGLARIERFGWHIIPLAIMTPFLAFGLYRLMIPLLIAFGMFMTPDVMLRSIDTNTIKTLDLKFMKDTQLTQDNQAAIQARFDILVAQAQNQNSRTRRVPNYKLLFRDSKIIGPNAFALPGGTIVMTDALVKLFPDEDFVLDAVLAHEIGHVDGEHSLRQIYRALGMAAMIGLIAGDAGPMLEDIILEGSALLSLSFSRKHEMHADNFSYDLLKAAGLRTDGLIVFFEKIDEDFGAPKDGEWMMTHPLSDKRVNNIKSRMARDNVNIGDNIDDKVKGTAIINDEAIAADQ